MQVECPICGKVGILEPPIANLASIARANMYIKSNYS
jgi:hypothetical protein